MREELKELKDSKWEDTYEKLGILMQQTYKDNIEILESLQEIDKAYFSYYDVNREKVEEFYHALSSKNYQQAYPQTPHTYVDKFVAQKNEKCRNSVYKHLLDVKFHMVLSTGYPHAL